MGVDINAQNIYGDTALIYASKYNNLEAAQLLLQNGADSSLTNMFGKSAFDKAVTDEMRQLLA